jgi:hypothetical protein
VNAFGGPPERISRINFPFLLLRENLEGVRGGLWGLILWKGLKTQRSSTPWFFLRSWPITEPFFISFRPKVGAEGVAPWQNGCLACTRQYLQRKKENQSVQSLVLYLGT